MVAGIGISSLVGAIVLAIALRVVVRRCVKSQPLSPIVHQRTMIQESGMNHVDDLVEEPALSDVKAVVDDSALSHVNAL